mgnify:FL=1
MDESKKYEKALNVYNVLLATLDDMKWKYEKNDKELTVTYTVTGEDIPMTFYMIVDPGLQAVRCFSFLPVTFPEDRRVDGVIASCAAGCGLYEGKFFSRLEDGRIVFNSASSFMGCEVNGHWFAAMMGLAHQMVDEQNDRFLMLSKGMITLQDFMTKK